MNINPKFGMMAAAVVYVGTAALNPAGAAVMPPPAEFSGKFTKDNDVQFFQITLTAPSLLAISSGYAAGGFDPILSLFDSTGLLIAENDDQAPGTNPDPELVLPSLAQGSYTLALTQ